MDAGTNSAVVVGSGIGGLFAAARLATAGCRVTVLEQANEAGGYLNPFKRKGFDFSPGLHIISENEEAPFGRALSRMGIELDYIRLPELGFEIHHFPDLEIPFSTDQSLYFQRLEGLFPDSVPQLRRFARLITRMGHDLDWFNDQPLTTRAQFIRASIGLVLRLSPMVRHSKKTWQQLLNRYISDPNLQAVLSAWCNAVGLPPEDMACIAGAGYYRTFGDHGGNYVRGGGRAIRDGLVHGIEAHGGTVRCKSPVARITTDGRRATGVVLEQDDERIDADVVVSGADPMMTFGRLLADYDHPAAVRRKLERFRPAYGYFFLCLGLRKEGIEDNPLLSVSTRRVFSSYDVNAHFDRQRVQDGLGPFYFLTCPTARDASKAPEGHAILEVVSAMSADLVMEWADLPVYKRGEEYARVKSAYIDRVLDRLEEFIPDLRQRIVVQEAGTPATNWSYTRNTGGSGAGMALTPAQMGASRFPIISHVDGLFSCGSGSPLGPSIVRCAKSGWVAAGCALEHLAPGSSKRTSIPGSWG